jgi:hypothetical protein
VQKDLENYATVKTALARWSTVLTVKGSPATVAAAKAAISTTINADSSSGEHNPPPVAGSMFMQREGAAKIEGFKSAGLQANPDEGRRLGLMVSAGTGIPETMLWGDATLGNYATAKSLDRPTELQMTARQQDWADTFTDVIGYALDAAALARKGPMLKGKKKPDVYSGADVVVITGKGGKELDRQVDVGFPAILEHDPLAEAQAIAALYAMGGYADAGVLDKATVARLALIALRVPNVDEVLARYNHPDEPLVPPEPTEPVPVPPVPPVPGAPAPGAPAPTPPVPQPSDDAPADVPDAPAATE